MDTIGQVREIAVRAHGEQKYGDGRPYVVHLDEVEAIVREFGYDDPSTRQAAILHDILEDTNVTAKGLNDLGVSLEVIILVQFCTDEEGHNRKTRKAKTYERWAEEKRRDPYWLPKAIRVKLADRIGNLRSCHRNNLTGLLQMYQKEKDVFKDALHLYGMADAMWAEYDRLVGDKKA